MVSRLIKLTIGWLLMTSPSIHGDVTRSATSSIPFIHMTEPRTTATFMAELTSSLGASMTTSAQNTVTSEETDTLTSDESAVTASASKVCVTQRNTFTGTEDSVICREYVTETTEDYISTTVVASSPPQTKRPHVRFGGLMDSADYQRAAYVIQLIAVPVMLIGIVTNSLTLLVYMLHMPNNVTSTFFSLATWLDLAFLLTGLPQSLAILVLGEERAMQNYFYIVYGLYVSNYVTVTLHKVIVCVTMLLSVDRYLMVAFPLRMKKFQHQRRPKLYTLLIALCVFLLDMNILFKFRPIPRAPSSNETVSQSYAITRTEALNENEQLFNDLSLISSSIFKYTPLVLLVIANVLLAGSLLRYSRSKKAGFGKHKNVFRAGMRGSSVDTSSSAPTFTAEINVTAAMESALEDVSRGSVATGHPLHTCPHTEQGQGHDGQGRGTVTRMVEGPDHGTERRAVQGQRPKPHQAMSSLPMSSQRYSSQQRQASVTVLVYSFLFTLLATPSALYPLLRKVVPGFSPFDRQHYLVLTLNILYFLLDTVSSAMNFVVYFFTGTVFRQHVVAMLTRNCRK